MSAAAASATESKEGKAESKLAGVAFGPDDQAKLLEYSFGVDALRCAAGVRVLCVVYVCCVATA
jgi:hypothetical protein